MISLARPDIAEKIPKINLPVLSFFDVSNQAGLMAELAPKSIENKFTGFVLLVLSFFKGKVPSYCGGWRHFGIVRFARFFLLSMGMLCFPVYPLLK